MSLASDFFGSGGIVGLFPVFTPKRTMQSRVSGEPEGFLGNGDVIQLPTVVGATGTLTYRNNVNTIIWGPVVPTAIHANCTAWMTFSLDSVDALLWVVAQDDINNVLYLATIDAAGTIVNVGNAATTGNLADVGTGWISVVSQRSGANMLRAVEGAGNFTLHATNLRFEIDYTNGAIVTETALTDGKAGAFESTSGSTFNVGSTEALNAGTSSGTLQRFILRTPFSFDATRLATATLLAPLSLGLPNSLGTVDTYCALQWNGDVMLVNPGNASLGTQQVLYDTTEFRLAVDKLVSNFNMDQ